MSAPEGEGTLLERMIRDGRTDLVFEYLAQGGAAAAKDDEGVSLLICAYCGDVGAVRLLGAGADPNRATKPGVETGCFMRDCRARGETPLHCAAAYGTEETMELLLEAGAAVDVKDVNGDSPLSWASWALRPDSVLLRLCYGRFSIRPDRRSMESNLLGRPHGAGKAPER